jgi:hypothetical protein
MPSFIDLPIFVCRMNHKNGRQKAGHFSGNMQSFCTWLKMEAGYL